MTSIAAPLPRRNNPKLFFMAIIAAFIIASFGIAFTKALMGNKAADVTLKPCLTCPSCSCKPLLGGPRCGCPR